MRLLKIGRVNDAEPPVGSGEQGVEVAQDGMGSSWDGFQDALVESELKARQSGEADNPPEESPEMQLSSLLVRVLPHARIHANLVSSTSNSLTAADG